MAIRYFSEFKSDLDNEYKIEIHDTEFVGVVESFNVSGDGFALSYDGQTDNIVSSIIGSQCDIFAYNNTSTFNNLIEDLKLYQEERFFVRIYKRIDITDFFEPRVVADGGTVESMSCLLADVAELGGSAQMELFWTGIILQDLIEIEDVSKPYIFKISATDGIGHLANQEYTGTVNTTVNDLLKSAIDAIGMADLYSSTDPYFATTVNIWDTNQVYSTATDVLNVTRFDALVYAEKDEDGTVTYSNYLTIINELCLSFGARFYQKNGAFYFEQYLERSVDIRRVFEYDKTGVQLSNNLVDDDIIINQTLTSGARLSGNKFNFLPALKKVQIAYNQSRMNNLLANRLTFTGSTARQPMGFVTDDNDSQIRVQGLLTYRFDYNGTGATASKEFYRPMFAAEIRIEDAASPGTFHYLKRDFIGTSLTPSPLYGPTSWTTSASHYYLDAGMGANDISGLYIQNPFAFITPPLPVDGDAELDINFSNVYDLDNNAQTVPVNYTDTNRSTEVTATFINNDGDPNVVTTYSATNTDAKINSNLILDLGEIRLSDSNGSQGSYYVYNGANWVASSLWRRSNTGTYYTLLKLLTKEILSLHKKPIERYNGTVVGSHPFSIRYSFDSAYWLPMSGSYNANNEEWSSEWFKIQSIETEIQTDTPVGTTGAGGAAGSFGRVSPQAGTAETIDAIQVTTTTSQVTGNGTVGGTLGVTGLSTLASTSVGAFTTTNQVAKTVNSISGGPGGGVTIDNSKNFNLVSYSGAVGSYTITLPPAEDGVVLQFKADDSIGATKTIILQVYGTERIEGESTYTITDAYGNVTLLGKNHLWFII